MVGGRAIELTHDENSKCFFKQKTALHCIEEHTGWILPLRAVPLTPERDTEAHIGMNCILCFARP